MPDKDNMSRDLVPSDSGKYYGISDTNLMEDDRVRTVAAKISTHGGRVLDIGCGTGAFGTLLASNCVYTGVDLHVKEASPDAMFQCDHQMLEADACHTLPFDNEAFDYITSFWCIEHLPDPKTMLDEAFRVLKPEGLMYLVFPNYSYPLFRCPSWWCSINDDDSIRGVLRRRIPSEILQQLSRRGVYLVRQLLKQVSQDLSPRYMPFEINLDPACNHLPWSRDRDAIHIVSPRSIVRYLTSKRMRLTNGALKPLHWLRREPKVFLELQRQA
jgi:SAM-dependent methyltransferase